MKQPVAFLYKTKKNRNKKMSNETITVEVIEKKYECKSYKINIDDIDYFYNGYPMEEETTTIKTKDGGIHYIKEDCLNSLLKLTKERNFISLTDLGPIRKIYMNPFRMKIKRKCNNSIVVTVGKGSPFFYVTETYEQIRDKLLDIVIKHNFPDLEQ